MVYRPLPRPSQARPRMPERTAPLGEPVSRVSSALRLCGRMGGARADLCDSAWVLGGRARRSPGQGLTAPLTPDGLPLLLCGETQGPLPSPGLLADHSPDLRPRVSLECSLGRGRLREDGGRRAGGRGAPALGTATASDPCVLLPHCWVTS